MPLPASPQSPPPSFGGHEGEDLKNHGACRALTAEWQNPVAVLFLGVALLSGIACQTSAPPPASTSGTQLAIDIPSPLTGPGRDPIDSAESRAITGAWANLLSGRTSEALETVTRFTSSQAELLRLQAGLAEEPSPGLQDRLETFTDEHSQYAAGWATLSVAAEAAGDEDKALEAARRNSRLWASGPYAARAEELQQRWITDRIERSGEILAGGQPMEALALVDLALALDPENQGALLVRAETLVSLQQGPEAEATLSRLGALPEALILRAEMASAQGRWQHAMDLLDALPDDHPDKSRSLRRAQLMWRISILPPHVQEAVNAESVTREDLAVILLALVPSLEVVNGGNTPLMTDVIGLPSQRAILTVTRLDVMSADRVASLFHPQRSVARPEAQSAIESVCHLAGLSNPLWCEPDMSPDDGCISIQEPVKGMALVDILLSAELKADQ